MKEEQEITMTEEGMEDSRVYEAAFHVIPSLDEAAAAVDVAEIKHFIVSQGGSIIGSGEPMIMPLAYPIQKDIERKRYTFDRGYFAWFVFEAAPESAHAIKEMLGARMTIIRSLVVKTSKEAASDRRHPALLAVPFSNESSARDEEPVEEEVLSTHDDDSEPKKPLDVEQVDAEIAKLVVE